MAEDGGVTREVLVITKTPFGRVDNIWYEDMGLRPVGLDIVNEDEDNGVVMLEKCIFSWFLIFKKIVVGLVYCFGWEQ